LLATLMGCMMPGSSALATLSEGFTHVPMVERTVPLRGKRRVLIMVVRALTVSPGVYAPLIYFLCPHAR